MARIDTQRGMVEILNERNLEELKSLLNKPYLEDFIKERIGSPKENEMKERFLKQLSKNKLSDDEIKVYANYMINVMRQQLNPELTPDISDDVIQLSSLISTMWHMYQLDFYAFFRNLEATPKQILTPEQAYSLPWEREQERVPRVEETSKERFMRELNERWIDPYDINRIRNLSFDTWITQYSNSRTWKRESRPNSYLNYNPAFWFNDWVYWLEDYEIINLWNNRYNAKLRFWKFWKTNAFNKSEEPVIDFDFEYYWTWSNSIKIIYQNRSRVLNILGNSLVILESFWRDLWFSKRELPHIELNLNTHYNNHRRR